MIDRDAAAPLRPGGLGAGRQTVESDCSEFWQALGRQQTVYQSEQLIAELVASGIDYADIVAGAKRYAEYCTRTGAAQKMTPASWLSNRKWLDDWQLPAAKSDKPSKPKQTERNNQIKNTVENPDWLAWSQSYIKATKERVDAFRDVGKHISGELAEEYRITLDSDCGCPDCEALWEHYKEYGEEYWVIAENAPTENLCAIGRDLYEKLEAARKEKKKIEKRYPRYLGDIEDGE